MAEYWLNALVTLLVTIDPIGLAPVFIILTARQSGVSRRRVALRATVAAAIILVAFALVGERLIGMLGISLSAFRVSGGLLLFWIAFEMIFERREDRRAAVVTEEHHRDVAIFPLAIPMIAGPGAISATILLASRAPGMTEYAGLIGIIVLIILGCFAVFELAARLDRFLGETGRTVLSRLLGLILAALAVQFVGDGVRAFLH